MKKYFLLILCLMPLCLLAQTYKIKCIKLVTTITSYD